MQINSWFIAGHPVFTPRRGTHSMPFQGNRGSGVNRYFVSTMKSKNLCLSICIAVIAGCDTASVPTDSLSAYVAASRLPVSDQLIACAGGGADDLQTRADAPISIYFYPIEGAGDFKYFETSAVDQDPDNFELYEEVKLDESPFFNGYLWRFHNIPLTEERWSRISFRTGDSLHVSNAIRLKYPVKPTIYDSTTVIVTSNGVNPSFSWPSVDDPTDAIYFQVVADRNGDLISGTYTFEKTFTFYDLDNVVLNIRDELPAPSLDLGESYSFTLMTVSQDNWVNLIAERQFKAE